MPNLTLALTVTRTDDGQEYVAKVRTLHGPACLAYGSTAHEARRKAEAYLLAITKETVAA